MSEEPSSYRIESLKLFVILIALLLIPSCVSHFPAPVQDRSLSVSNSSKIHIVIPGDTLFSIAWRYGLKYETLAIYNGISPPYIIRPSQVIRLNVVDPHASKVTTGSLEQRIVNVNPYSKTGNKPPLPANKNNSNRQENKTEKVAGGTSKVQPWAVPQWRWPAAGPLIATFQGSNALNKGIDLGGKLGEPVLAAATGQVVYSGSGLRGYGKLLIVKHSETFLSAYAHNDRLLVKEGDFVKVGHRIADMGSSGTDRVKLHFEIRRDGTPVDPLKFLPRR